jgi:signal transduction histidine kinase
VAIGAIVRFRERPCPAEPFDDADRISSRLFLNLLSNAIKYSDPDKGDSFVEVALVGNNDDSCTISVRDNGLGIPEADQPLVFERFFRAHADRDQELGVSGSGLGLAIVADCVRALDGSIRFESTVGRGTTFSIALPRASALG